VLLFPGDAEIESWSTWENSHADVDDLLARTVLYKVGHHGSINATPTSRNPEADEIARHRAGLLANSELVALIPVDQATAAGLNWQFPATDVMSELSEKTRGRVVLNCTSDCPDCPPSYPVEKFPANMVRQDSSPERLWVEFIIPC
jgi:hypothetical protein